MFTLKGYGVDYLRMGCMGYGEFRPRVPNPPRGGSEENRRVEIFLVSSKEHVPGMDAAMYKNKNDGSVYAKMAAPKAPEKESSDPNSDDAGTP